MRTLGLRESRRLSGFSPTPSRQLARLVRRFLPDQPSKLPADFSDSKQAAAGPHGPALGSTPGPAHLSCPDRPPLPLPRTPVRSTCPNVLRPAPVAGCFGRVNYPPAARGSPPERQTRIITLYLPNDTVARSRAAAGPDKQRPDGTDRHVLNPETTSGNAGDRCRSQSQRGVGACGSGLSNTQVREEAPEAATCGRERVRS